MVAIDCNKYQEMRKDIVSTDVLPNFDPCIGNGF
jgi:hypothetical protein